MNKIGGWVGGEGRERKRKRQRQKRQSNQMLQYSRWARHSGPMSVGCKSKCKFPRIIPKVSEDKNNWAGWRSYQSVWWSRWHDEEEKSRDKKREKRPKWKKQDTTSKNKCEQALVTGVLRTPHLLCESKIVKRTKGKEARAEWAAVLSVWGRLKR